MVMIFFDTETNGQVTPHRIVEFAYIAVSNTKRYTFRTLVRQEDISLDISTLTGINRNDIWKYGVKESKLASHVKQLLELHPIMVAHNCQFDLSMVYDLLERHYGSNMAYTLVSECQWIDTLTIVKDRKSYPHRLSDCITHYKCDGQNSHNALDDAKALYQVFKAIMLERPDGCHYENTFGYNPKYPINDNDKFDFITYKPQSTNRGFVDNDNILPFI